MQVLTLGRLTLSMRELRSKLTLFLPNRLPLSDSFQFAVYLLHSPTAILMNLAVIIPIPGLSIVFVTVLSIIYVIALSIICVTLSISSIKLMINCVSSIVLNFLILIILII